MSQGRAEEYRERPEPEGDTQDDSNDEGGEKLRDELQGETTQGQEQTRDERDSRWRTSPQEEAERLGRYRASSRINQELLFKIRENAETPEDLENHLLDRTTDTGIMHAMQRERLELFHSRDHLPYEEATQYRNLLEGNRTHTQRRLELWEYNQGDILALTTRLEEQIDHMVSERTQDPQQKRDADFKRACTGFMEKFMKKEATDQDAREILESRFKDLSDQGESQGTSQYQELNHRLSLLDEAMTDINLAMREAGYNATEREEAREILEDEYARMKIRVIHELESSAPASQGKQYQERKKGIRGILKRVVRGRG